MSVDDLDVELYEFLRRNHKITPKVIEKFKPGKIVFLSKIQLFINLELVKGFLQFSKVF